MELIKDFGVYGLYCIEKDEYLQNFEDVNNLMYRVLASREKIDDKYNEGDAMEQINDLNAEFFTKEFLDAKVYVLVNKHDKTPASFVIYSHDEEREDWHLEYIVTHAEYSNMGLGCALMKLSAEDLKNTPYTTISTVVNKNNIPSLYMHNAFTETRGVESSLQDLDDGRYLFEFDIKNLNLNNDEDMEMSIY